jgi:hypothetical protein
VKAVVNASRNAGISDAGKRAIGRKIYKDKSETRGRAVSLAEEQPTENRSFRKVGGL